MVGPQIARLVGAGRVDQAGLALRTATTWNVHHRLAALPRLRDDPAVWSCCSSVRATSRANPVVVILALGMLVGIAAGPVDIALLMLGRSVQSLRNNMTALVTNLVLNLALVPVLGITGAALAWSAAIVVSNALPGLADPPRPRQRRRPEDRSGRRAWPVCLRGAPAAWRRLAGWTPPGGQLVLVRAGGVRLPRAAVPLPACPCDWSSWWAPSRRRRG